MIDKEKVKLELANKISVEIYRWAQRSGAIKHYWVIVTHEVTSPNTTRLITDAVDGEPKIIEGQSILASGITDGLDDATNAVLSHLDNKRNLIHAIQRINVTE